MSARSSSRLAVEQRILAMLALLGLIHAGFSALWIALALEPDVLALLARPAELGSLLGVSLAAIVACVLHVTLRLPEVRWPRVYSGSGGGSGPSPWPLALLGAPSLLVWPLLAWRERRATRRDPDATQTHEVELGFRQLLAIPRIAATSFAA